MESLYETNTCRIWSITLQGLFCVCTYFRVISLSNNNRLLHKHLLWQGHNLVIGVWSGSIIVCDLLKLSRQNTTHVPCLHPDGERITITRLCSAIDGWKSNFNRSGEINDSPRNHFTERSRAMILIPGWDLNPTTFCKMSFIQCMTDDKLTLFNLLSS